LLVLLRLLLLLLPAVALVRTVRNRRFAADNGGGDVVMTRGGGGGGGKGCTEASAPDVRCDCWVRFVGGVTNILGVVVALGCCCHVLLLSAGEGGGM
jgi:hypothetical protein